MNLIALDGTTVLAVRAIQDGEKIVAVPSQDRRKRILVGAYESIERAQEVFEEMGDANRALEEEFKMSDR